MYKSFFFFSFILATVNLRAQNASDALRYSLRQYLGSARYVGVGGSMSAIGGDFEAIADNPASLANYHFSEISLTPSLYYNQNKSQLGNGSFSSENKYGGSLDHLGLVFVKNGYDREKWRNVNFAIGVTKVADYNHQTYFLGSTTGSITDHWREQSLNKAPANLDNYSGGLAYDAGAIYDSNNDQVYESDFTNYPNVPVTKSQLIKSSGSMNELSFSLAGNLKDYLMIGASVGIPILSYNEVKIYTESDPANKNPVFEGLQYTEYLKTQGSGINLKLGAIIKVHNAFRIGLSFQTPTAFELNDTYSTKLDYSYLEKGQVQSQSKTSPETGAFNYNLITPMRARASFGSVIGKLGFFGGSVEYVNYKSASFNFNAQGTTQSDIDYQNKINQDITKQYSSAFNYNLGGEIAVDVLRFRAGINLTGSPYANEKDYTQTFTAGIGYRGGKFFTDLALRHTSYDDGYYPYTTASNDPQFVYTKHQQNRLVLSLGYKF